MKLSDAHRADLLKYVEYYIGMEDPNGTERWPMSIAHAIKAAVDRIDELEASPPAASIEEALVTAADVARWRSACAAEVEAHNETRNVAAGNTRKLEATAARLAEVETQLGLASRRLSAAKTMLEGAGLAMPEEPRHTGEWYACAVCSLKTDAPPALMRRHSCCGRNAYLGPCCAAAQERSPEDVASIMLGAGHVAGCRGMG